MRGLWQIGQTGQPGQVGVPFKRPAELRQQVQRLTGELDRARQVIEVQSKLSALLDSLATDSSRNDSER